MTEGLTVYFSADEFQLCCAAVGIQSFYGFSAADGLPTRRNTAQALFSLVQRGLLYAGEKEFTLCPDLSSCFGLLRESESVVLAYQRKDALRQPCCLLYGGGERFVSLAPGRRQEDYTGVTAYRDEAEWLRDVGLAPEEEPPEGLAEPADWKRDPACQKITRFAAGGPAPDRLPEEVFGYLESRRVADWHLTARALLVRQALFDCMVVGADGRTSAEACRLNRLAALVREMRMGKVARI